MAEAVAGPVLTLDVKRCAGDVFVIACHGRLVAGTTQVLSSAVTELLPGAKRIVLDLSDLKHTDSMGLGTMVRLYVTAKGAGCSLELMHLSQQIRNLLGLTNLFSVFAVVGENGVKFL
ncbi:MAG TPA: STAS domain-containing protein [Acidobacteriaceae bacterium]|nr:STAS domain-containing protein [Acidobacteriaceae bacterium]